MTVRKMDLDKDGRICYDDFEETVSQGIPKLKTNFWRQKRINIIKYLVLTNKK